MRSTLKYSSVIIFYTLTLGYNHYNNHYNHYNNGAKKNRKIKPNLRNHTTLKYKLNSDILILIVGGLLSDSQ